MIHQFDEEGFCFRYPEHWTLEREESETRWTVTVQSPETAFLMLTVDAEMPEVQDVIATTLDALKEDYPDLEAEECAEDLAGQPAIGHEIRFFSFDFLNWLSVARFEPVNAITLVRQIRQVDDFHCRLWRQLHQKSCDAQRVSSPCVVIVRQDHDETTRER